MSIDSIDPQAASRHIYPKLAQRLTSADLHRLFRRNYEERRWVPTIARTPSSQVTLLVQLKIFQAVCRFLPVEEIPHAAIEHVARELGVDEEVRHLYSDSTLYRHHSAVLERLRITAWGAAARELEKRLSERKPERPLLAAIANTEHWTQWARHLGPPSRIKGAHRSGKVSAQFEVHWRDSHAHQSIKRRTRVATASLDMRILALRAIRAYQRYISPHKGFFYSSRGAPKRRAADRGCGWNTRFRRLRAVHGQFGD